MLIFTICYFLAFDIPYTLVVLDTFWADKQPKEDLLRSTGLYAKAGTLVEVTVAKELIDKIKVL